MNKFIIVFLTVLFVVFVFSSCDTGVSEENAGCLVEISFDRQTDGFKDLTASVQQITKSDLYWRYTARKLDYAGNIGQTTSTDIKDSLPVVVNGNVWKAGLSGSGSDVWKHTFSIGEWEFSLYAFVCEGDFSPDVTSQSDKCIYAGTVKSEISGTNHTIIVPVSGISEGGGSGTIDCTDVTKPYGISETSVLKYKVKDGEWISCSETTITDIADNPHTVYIGVFESGSNDPAGNPMPVVITVYRGLVSKIEGSPSI